MKEPKPRMILITDSKAIEAIMAKGKYREALPYWTRAGDALWVLKTDTSGKTL